MKIMYILCTGNPDSSFTTSIAVTDNKELAEQWEDSAHGYRSSDIVAITDAKSLSELEGEIKELQKIRSSIYMERYKNNKLYLR